MDGFQKGQVEVEGGIGTVQDEGERGRRGRKGEKET